jgi:two-component system, LuxR family, sensor kinase FixL
VLDLESVVAGFLKAGKIKVLSLTAATILPIALADWYIGSRASLGVLYIVPMMMAATVSAPAGTVCLAFLCSFLRSLFDLPSPHLESMLRFIFAVLAYSGSGLFVTALIRNRDLVLEHLGRMGREQELRRRVEEQLRILVESSPAAILTTDAAGCVLACNQAADLLFLIGEGGTLQSRSIGDYIPLLADALKLDPGSEGLHTAAQCQGRRDNGEIFLAHIWFSSYAGQEGRRLAAIVVDSSEEMRDREEEGLRQLMRGNRIAAAAVSHEVRNLCGAISLICSNLGKKYQFGQDEDLRGLATLVTGLEKIASYELQVRVHDELEKITLQEVLDDLRIVIEPDWREIDGKIHWSLPPDMPAVLGQRSGLLQAFLNLAHNSHRAVQGCSNRQLHITASVEERVANVRFRDSGAGISDTKLLFEPFQSGSEGSGLGLYVSRAVVRSYGGDLCYEPQEEGTCFRVELPIV